MLATPSRAPPSFRLLKVRTLALPGAGQRKVKREGEMMGGTVSGGVEVTKPLHTHSTFCADKGGASSLPTAAWRDFLGSVASSVFCEGVKEGN